MKFSTAKKGYNSIEVDNYVSQATEALAKQKERIQKLKSKITLLEKELETYYEKKELILSALSEAVNKAEEIERKANQKYDQEIQRLRKFHDKWTQHYEKQLKKGSNNSSGLDGFNRDMQRILKETEWISDDNEKSQEDYASDKKSKKTDQVSIDSKTTDRTPLERIKSYLDNEKTQEKKSVAPSEEGIFSLDEALHPKQDLVDIMKDLGLIDN